MASGSSFAKSVAQSIVPLIDLVYPPRCPLCGAATAEQGGLCAPCKSSLVIPGEPSCASFSRPFPPDFLKDDEIQCAQCLAKPQDIRVSAQQRSITMHRENSCWPSSMVGRLCWRGILPG
ncbi:double zinc ribbon domain-containing protein [Altererythrobacter ishigakiensis]|uniref:double zinc ribbon domain-containing protein n=1 Tax=Altererythrobacter ishigakiensis TaxID=476157 RepID=UPI00316ACBEB